MERRNQALELSAQFQGDCVTALWRKGYDAINGACTIVQEHRMHASVPLAAGSWRLEATV